MEQQSGVGEGADGVSIQQEVGLGLGLGGGGGGGDDGGVFMQQEGDVGGGGGGGGVFMQQEGGVGGGFMQQGGGVGGGDGGESSQSITMENDESALKKKEVGKSFWPTKSESEDSLGEESLGEEDDDDDEENGMDGVFASMASLEASLPIKRGLSSFYVGRSKSSANIPKVRSVEQLAKRERRRNKKRRILLGYKFHSEADLLSMPAWKDFDDHDHQGGMEGNIA